MEVYQRCNATYRLPGRGFFELVALVRGAVSSVPRVARGAGRRRGAGQGSGNMVRASRADFFFAGCQPRPEPPRAGSGALWRPPAPPARRGSGASRVAAWLRSNSPSLALFAPRLVAVLAHFGGR